MDWIFENFEIVVVVLIALGSFLKSRFDPVIEEPEGRDDFPDYEEIDTRDESYRKMPPESPSGPPPLYESAGPPPLPTVQYNSPEAQAIAEQQAARELEHQRKIAEQLRKIRETRATTTGGAAATRARIASSKSGAATPTAATIPLSYRARLKDPAEVRRAFVMREILGRPVGMR